MPYIGKSPQFGVRSRFYYTQSSAGGTSVSGTDDNGKTLKFSDGEFVDVMLNGVTLVAGTDYNTSTANTIGSLAALSNGDVVEVVVYDTFSVADTVSAKDGGTFSGAVAFTGGISNLIRIQTFTADGTYTKSTGATKALVYVVGGGGGGGGIDGQGSGTTGAGGGGGAGGMATKLITSGLGATETVTVGDGAAGGSGGSGGSSGSTGGTSSFGSHCSATGGGGGGVGTASAVSNATIRNGGTGGVGSSGDINTTGQPGSPGIAAGTSTSEAVSGNGGSTIFGGGARSVNGDQNGEDCADLTQAGGGGSGACNTDTAGNYRGGNGGNGIVVVYEYL